MHQVTNPLQACNDIFFKPNGVFHAIGEKDNWSWLPFFIVTIMAALPAYLYFNAVDISWYQDMVISNQYGELSPAEQDQYRQGMTRTAMTAFALIGTVVGLLVINAIIAVYLNLVSRNDEDCVHGFTDWFGFTWWTGMPVVVNSLIAVVLLLVADGYQIDPVTLAPLSLAFILGADMSSDWFGLLQTIRLDIIWSVYLTMVGVRQWTRFSNQKSAVIAIIPLAVILGIWLLAIIL
ncbi:Yip1 family protein [Alteromonas halophila]|uniref:Membrane protein n=1 Tax=Alteromonas halophila TaxID=516698 RepID=A0A918JEX4_9ALTE|nr:Yip1 family protein [Alteromonas halophila]GGW74422.1 membrane protein [Alteromonas halophila]